MPGGKMNNRKQHSKKYKLAVLSSHPIQYFAPLYRRLACEENIDLTVYYCSSQGVEAYQDRELGVSLKWDVPLLEGYRYKFLPDIGGKVSSQSMNGSVQPAVFWEILRGGYDALWVYSYKYPTYLLAMAAAKLSGTALLLRTDSQMLSLQHPRGTLNKNIRFQLLKQVMRLFDGVLAIGTSNTNYYRKLGVPDRKIFLTPFTVDNQHFMAFNHWEEEQIRAARQTLGIPSDATVILFVGKLLPNKQPFILLNAFQQVQKTLDNPVALVFVGEGALRAEMEQYCRDKDIQNVVFAGFVNQSSLNQYYAVSNIFVLPTVAEAWGLVVNEAMCAKNAIVVTETVGAAQDLVHPGENGFTFAVDDTGGLITALCRLAGDPALCRQMGQRSLEIIRRWSFEEDVTGILQALSHVKRKETDAS